MTWLYLNQKLNRLINAEYQHKSKSVTKGYPLFIQLDHKICIIFYFMSKLWNNTQITDLQKIRYIFNTHIAKDTLACHTRSLKYAFYMLVAKLLPSQSTFMHLENKNVHIYFFAFAATAFLHYLKFANKNKIFPF